MARRKPLHILMRAALRLRLAARAGGLLSRAAWQRAAPDKHLRVFAHTDAFSAPPQPL